MIEDKGVSESTEEPKKDESASSKRQLLDDSDNNKSFIKPRKINKVANPRCYIRPTYTHENQYSTLEDSTPGADNQSGES